MRLMLELAVVAALIAFGWNRSFSEQFGMTGQQPASTAQSDSAKASRPASPAIVAGATAEPTRARIAPAPVVVPSATPDNSWMWDPNRKGSLDRKSKPQPTP